MPQSLTGGESSGKRGRSFFDGVVSCGLPKGGALLPPVTPLGILGNVREEKPALGDTRGGPDRYTFHGGGGCMFKLIAGGTVAFCNF